MDEGGISAQASMEVKNGCKWKDFCVLSSNGGACHEMEVNYGCDV